MSATDPQEQIAQDAELLARYLSEQENAQDLGLEGEALEAQALKQTLSWNAQGRPE